MPVIGSDKENALREKMERFGIKEADIVERFVHSGGPGGQNVNKTSTCVYLKHVPTGIEVKCQRDGPRAMNRFFLPAHPYQQDRESRPWQAK